MNQLRTSWQTRRMRGFLFAWEKRWNDTERRDCGTWYDSSGSSMHSKQKTQAADWSCCQLALLASTSSVKETETQPAIRIHLLTSLVPLSVSTSSPSFFSPLHTRKHGWLVKWSFSASLSKGVGYHTDIQYQMLIH